MILWILSSGVEGSLGLSLTFSNYALKSSWNFVILVISFFLKAQA